MTRKRTLVVLPSPAESRPEPLPILVSCPACSYLGVPLLRRPRFSPLSLLRGLVLPELANALIHLGQVGTRTCPQCGATRSVVPASGPPGPGAHAIWLRASEADEKSARNSNLAWACFLFALMLFTFWFVAKVWIPAEFSNG